MTGVYAVRMLRHAYFKEPLPPYQAFCEAYNLVLFDRFGACNPPLPYVLHRRSAHRPRPTTDRYADLCDRRAHELIATGRRIRFFWSGGIDSTAALVALMRANVPRDQMQVALSWDSMIENRRFLDRHIIDRFDWIEAPAIAASVTDDEVLTVDGEHNDQLFGSDVLIKVSGVFGDEGRRAALTGDAFCATCERVLGVERFDAAAMLVLILRSARAADVALETIHDAFWWLNFAFKWQDVALRSILRASEDLIPFLTEQRVEANFVHFYAAPYFQDWAVSTHEPKIGREWRTYKLPAKRYIHAFDGDAEYLTNAVKVGSLWNLYQTTASKHFMAIEAPWRLTRDNDPFVYRKRGEAA